MYVKATMETEAHCAIACSTRGHETEMPDKDCISKKDTKPYSGILRQSLLELPNKLSFLGL